MSQSCEHFSSEILVSASPEQVFHALTQEIDQWWTELSNPASKIGDQLTVRFEQSTYWVMQVSEMQPNITVSWKVTKANHDLQGLNTPNEWEGTIIHWDILQQGTKTRITLIHQGLTPILECYEICNMGWQYFLDSLKKHLETGEGNPYKTSTS